MTGARRLASLLALAGWIYSWLIFRGVRNEYAAGDIGGIPAWLTALLAITTTLLIGTLVTAAINIPVWTALAVVAGFFMLAAVVGGHYGVMNSALAAVGRPSAGVGDAVRATLRTRSALEVVLISGLPTLLVLSGLSGLILPRLSAPGSVARTEA